MIGVFFVLGLLLAIYIGAEDGVIPHDYPDPDQDPDAEPCQWDDDYDNVQILNM